MERNNKVFYLFIAIIVLVSPVFAQTTAEPVENIVNIIVDFLSLLFLAFAFLSSWSIYTNFREGQLAIPWGLIAAGVIFFFFGRILQAGDTANLWEMPMILKSFINLIVALALLVGMVLYKRTIS
ncbi:MAG: hypothetical protein ACLFSQ_00405 [Candidatus Zixiibacteriota bacterium]